MTSNNSIPDDVKAQLERALRDFEQARQTGQEFGRDRTGRLYTKADIYRTFGEYGRALQEWENELSAAREAHNAQEETYLLIIAGTYYAKIGSIQLGLEYINRGLALAEENGCHEQEAQAHLELGQLCFKYERNNDALDHFNKMLEIAQSIDNNRYHHLALGNIGAVYAQMERYQESINLIEQAGGIAQAVGDKFDEAQYARNMGMAYFHLREGSIALNYFDYYQQLCGEIHIPPDEGIVKFAEEIRNVYRKRQS